jgi:putative peptidoglycan lipid II flippase
MDDFRDTLAHSLGTVLLLTIPSSIGLAVMGESMIAAVYQWGRFTAFDTHQTAVALACYSAGLAGYSATKVLAPAFYALNSARIPMCVSLGSVALNLCGAFALVKWAGMGHAGLALSTSIVALAGSATLFLLMRARLGRLDGRRLIRGAAKILVAALIMGLVCRVCSYAVHAALGTGKGAQLADVAVCIPLGAAVFYFAASLLQVEELESVRNAVLHFLKECSPT